MSKDYYSVLGIDRTSNEEQIKKAYKKLALKYLSLIHISEPTRPY